MKNLCRKRIKIGASQTDFAGGVGLLGALVLFQDNMCEYYKQMTCDGIYMVPKCHAFWALTKTKIRFNKFVNWLDECDIKTDICKLSNIRMNLSSVISNLNGENVIDCIQELCGMDSDTRKFRTVDSIPYFPKDIDISDSFNDLTFSKFDTNIDDNDLCASVIINSSNVDYFGHTNNVEYVKFLYGALDYSFLKNIKILDFEIHYLKESSVGDHVSIYLKNFDNFVYFEIKNGSDTLTKARLNYVITGNSK